MKGTETKRHTETHTETEGIETDRVRVSWILCRDERDTETDKQANRQTELQNDSQTNDWLFWCVASSESQRIIIRVETNEWVFKADVKI